MLFTSNVFLFYFLPCMILLYYVFSFSRKVQNAILLVGSLLFYAWGEPTFVLVMLVSIIINTVFGYLVSHFKERGDWGKIFVFLSCAVNIGILFYFKYLTFVLHNLGLLLGREFQYNEIILPLGISFFTFQAISYVIDVYRGDAKLQKNPFYVGLYISFFPQLIAGPIVRYNSIAEQILHRKSTYRKFSVGCCRLITGFGKKLLIANSCAIVADKVFGMTPFGTVPVLLAWVGIIAYVLQIFFDFSSYSDMAIGLGLIFGFHFEENFDYPLISKSVNEFWRRWHISLSSWFREYVYFPLGGSRVNNNDIMVRNLFIVWMLTGIWHGAEWTFFLWGFLNFAFILLERLFKFEESNVPAAIKHIYLLFVLCMGFTLFRAENLDIAIQYFKNLFGASGSGFFSETAFMFVREFGVFFMAAFLFSMPVAPRINKLLADKKMPVLGKCMEAAYPIALSILLLICMSYIIKGSYNPFIYFNF